ncbi:Hypothetical protein GbCGDNIH9_2344 [Granulibacter bethesdensis]|uniref:Thiamine phosphate synthase/TenI domain-containing protein n=1 Tax=Granulibacter bethesdensis TaxID=364410 RepID=A0AAC9KG42_9PROT|nr:thiamine phosphate synthase [Granulibacter bethesdensis]APH55673.1 Hypothetical protein GbCGDNIH9_2344 [Granulibacter bethesdensis]APH63258.1 Hypothetical protein GbCGDNIH8_2344 [Granulibacter bethesdensis]
MDQKLIAWARAVKAKAPRNAPPPLWLFTDHRRVSDPRPDIARLPRGLCGVVFRHDALPDTVRATLLHQVIRLCRARRLMLSVSGCISAGLPMRTQPHRRGGRLSSSADKASTCLPPVLRGRTIITASAHTIPEIRRAHRLGAGLIFFSPFLPTESHPGTVALGAARWNRLVRMAGRAHHQSYIAALGGIEGRYAALLRMSGILNVGAIGALHARH